MPTDRIFNFSAGPAVLPEPVLRKAQEAIWNVAGSGIGIMEHSHRGKVFDKIRDEAEQDCRDLAGISDGYEVLFLQGGASLQFSMVPMNLLPGRPDRGLPADRRVGPEGGEGGEDPGRQGAPRGQQRGDQLRPDPGGVGDQVLRLARRTCTSPPTTRSTAPSGGASRRCPPACRWSPTPRATCTAGRSTSTKYGLIYAGAQKNLGPSGVVLVIIRKDLVEAGRQDPAHHAAVPHPRGGEIAATTPRRPSRSTSWGRSSSGSRRRAASRRWRSTTRARRSCSTTTSTRATSSAARRSRTAARS